MVEILQRLAKGSKKGLRGRLRNIGLLFYLIKPIIGAPIFYYNQTGTDRAVRYRPNIFGIPLMPVFCKVFISFWVSRNCLISRLTA